MQINASALLASQQQVQGAQPRSAQAAFEPMLFKQAAKPTAAPSASAATAGMRAPMGMPTGTGPVRPGTHIDIKV